MPMSFMKASKLLKKIKARLTAVVPPYCLGILTTIVEEANSFDDILTGLRAVNYAKPSVVLGILGLVLLVLTLLSSFAVNRILRKQNISGQFARLMRQHTDETIQNIDNTYSWGYNYCLYYSQDPNGWLPKQFKITDYDQGEYRFPTNPPFTGYSQDTYQEFCRQDPKIKAIRDKDENRARFAVKHFKKNTNKDNELFDISIKKTNWVSLQFHWDYFRTFNAKTSEKVENPNIEVVQQQLLEIHKNQGQKFWINSFCLHLMIGTPKGIILSRIGRAKENDYPATWAATIGEQIEESDFYNKSSSKEGSRIEKNFIEKWVKRALNEEFGVDPETEYEELFDPDSLRLLSVDVEADIYNLALTCVIHIRGSFEEWMTKKAADIDRCENYELQECTLAQARDILLGYPENRKEYHPSTYLRILMYHRYKEGTERTKKLLLQKQSGKL